MLIVVFWIVTRVVLYVVANVSEEHITTIFRVNMEVIGYFETLAIIYKTTRRHNPKGHSGHLRSSNDVKTSIGLSLNRSGLIRRFHGAVGKVVHTQSALRSTEGP